MVGAATALLKGAGPVLLAGRPLPKRLRGGVALLAPTLLAALVATQVFAGDRRLVVDARAIGLIAAVFALLARLPVLAVVLIAATVTALARLVA